MAETPPPRVEWAVICAAAERGDDDELNLFHVFNSVTPTGWSDTTPIVVVFCLWGRPGIAVHLTLRALIPGREPTILGGGQPTPVAIDADGCGLGQIRIDDVPIDRPGNIKLEFRFGDDLAPAHVATLRVLATPVASRLTH